MCDYDSQVLVDEVVKEKVDEQKSFTAFDVSMEVKRRGGKERHRDMKSYIHQLMNNYLNAGSYNKTSVMIPNGNPPQAILYYHFMSDPASYQPMTRPSNNNANSSAAAVQPAIQVVDSGDDAVLTDAVDGLISADGKYSLDNRERLLVPTKFLREAGFASGDKVFVLSDNGKLVLSKDDSLQISISSLTVERNGDVRISSSLLKKAGLGSSNYSISHDGGNSIVVEAC